MIGQIVNLPEAQVPDIKDRTYFRLDYQAYETGLDSFHQLHCVVSWFCRLCYYFPVGLFVE